MLEGDLPASRPISQRVKELGNNQAPPEPQKRQKTLTPIIVGRDQFLRPIFQVFY